MNKPAIIHQMNTLDTYMINHDKALIKLKTEKDDLLEVHLHYADKYKFIFKRDAPHSLQMKKVAHDSVYDYYEGVMPMEGIVQKYFFEVVDHKGEKAFLGATEFFHQKPDHYSKMYDLPTRARQEDMFEIPDWVEKAIVYQIFPDRFYKGHGIECGKEWSAKVKGNTILGGTLNGIKDQLDYIEELGANVIYLTPIFQSPSNHKYDTTDYYAIDPSFGTKEMFKELVDSAHEKGMKVIVDGVFNHSGDTFEPFMDVVKKGEDSRYADWFEVNSFPIEKGGRHEMPSYDAFAYYGRMPKLKTRNEELTNYILDVVKYWTREFGIDGWRLDVADEVSHNFWKAFRKVVKSENPEALIIGEVWYDSSEWLRGDEFDTVMNYKFRNPVLDWIGKELIDVREFSNQINQVRGLYPLPAYRAMWNLIGSHDTARFLTECGHQKDKLKLAVLLQMVTTGTPFIYYGDEVGMAGGEDPDCRGGMVWDESQQDLELRQYYKHLIEIRKRYQQLRTGEMVEILVDQDHKCYGFEKHHENEVLTIYMNNGSKSHCLQLANPMRDLITGQVFDGCLQGNTGYILEEVMKK